MFILKRIIYSLNQFLLGYNSKGQKSLNKNTFFDSMISLSSNENKENDELKKLKMEIPPLEEIANKNYHHELLKMWGITIGVFLIALLVGLCLGLLILNYVSVPQITVDRSKIEDITKTVFTASVTVSGLILGFVPVVSFFFVRELKEGERFIRQQRNKQIEKYENQKEDENREDNLNTINTYYGLHLMLYRNLRSGILNYLRTYLLISLFLLFYLLILFFPMILNDLALFFIFINTLFAVVILTGISPIVQIALAEPTYRIVTYIIPEKIIKRIEPES